MDSLKNKKISGIIIIFSVLLIIYGFVSSYNENGEKNIPLTYFKVDLFGLNVSYTNFLLFFFIFLGVGIVLFFYSNDNAIKSFFINRKLSLKLIDYKKNLTKSKIPKLTPKHIFIIVKTATVIALIFTFIVGIKTEFTLYYFIILSYLIFIQSKPSSYKDIFIVALFFPIISAIIFGISSNSKELYDFPFTYHLTKNLIPFIISVIVAFFTLKVKLKREIQFSFRSVFFWVTSVIFVLSIVYFVLYLKVHE